MTDPAPRNDDAMRSLIGKSLTRLSGEMSIVVDGSERQEELTTVELTADDGTHLLIFPDGDPDYACADFGQIKPVEAWEFEDLVFSSEQINLVGKFSIDCSILGARIAAIDAIRSNGPAGWRLRFESHGPLCICPDGDDHLDVFPRDEPPFVEWTKTQFVPL